ncbi:MAG: CocE/NonD family hydrolase [Defluviimonas sp.]|nr:CocE/NonD family hydrolase [Defluviimonas sp.]
MRDGVRLAARLYRSRNGSAAPAIVTMTPYAVDRYHVDAMFFARAGYVFVAVDCRGRGDSEGRFAPSFIDFEDGHDTVEWIARQAFCDGQVAMWGGSYAGENQWNTLVTRPPHLRTVVPAAATHTPADYPWRGPVRSRYALQWLLSVGGRESSPSHLVSDDRLWRSAFGAHHLAGAAYADLPSYLGGTSPHFDEYLSHPTHDPYWRKLAFSDADYARIDIPILTIAGQYDEAQRGSLHYVREHERLGSAAAVATHFVVIGPWDHDGTRSGARQCGGVDFGPEAEVDLRDLTLRWYDWILRGGARPSMLKDRVTYYETGRSCWQGASGLAELSETSLALFLAGGPSPGGPERLEMANDHPGGHLEWRSDPSDIRPAAMEAEQSQDWLRDFGPYPQLFGGGFAFESAPLASGLSVAGWPSLSLWVGTDLPDADLQATLSEVGPDGTLLKLSEDMVRLRYRQGTDAELACTADQPMRLTFAGFTFVARRIAPGARLRLTICTVNSIHLQRNFQAGGNVDLESLAQARVGTIRILHGAAHPGVLSLPLR